MQGSQLRKKGGSGQFCKADEQAKGASIPRNRSVQPPLNRPATAAAAPAAAPAMAAVFEPEGTGSQPAKLLSCHPEAHWVQLQEPAEYVLHMLTLHCGLGRAGRR